MSTSTYTKGVNAEKAVINYFLQKKFVLVAHRYKTKYGEIDLILTKDNYLIFTEVKFRRVLPQEDIISENQKKRISRAAIHFLAENPMYDQYIMRFDCIFFDYYLKFLHIKNTWEINENDFQNMW